MSSPTSSRPRLRIAATAASASILLAKGRRLAVRSQAFAAGSGGFGASGGSSSMPAGVGGARVGTGGMAGSTCCVQPPRMTAAAIAAVSLRLALLA